MFFGHPGMLILGDLGLELGKTIKLEWHKAANTRLRCLRITSKEEKAVRKQLGVRDHCQLESRAHSRIIAASSCSPQWLLHEESSSAAISCLASTSALHGCATSPMAYQLTFCGGMSLQSMKYETLETRKDGTKFLSRDMKRAATRLQQLATAYDSKQQKLVEEACASSHRPG